VETKLLLFPLCPDREAMTEIWLRNRGYKPFQSRHKDVVSSLGASVDGSITVSGSYDGTVAVHETETGTRIATMLGHNSFVFCVHVSPDTQAVCSASHDMTVRIWRVENGACLAVLQGHAGGVTGCVFSSDGLRVLSSSLDRTMRVWELWPDRGSGDILEEPSSSVHNATQDDAAHVFTEARLGFGVQAASDQGGASAPHRTASKRAATGRSRAPSQRGRPATARATTGYSHVSEIERPSTRLDDMRPRCALVLAGHKGPLRGCGYSADGRSIVSCSEDGTAQIWDPHTGAPLAVLGPHDDVVHAAAIEPLNSRLAATSCANEVVLWDLSALSLSGQHRLSSASIEDQSTPRAGRMRTLRGHRKGVLRCRFSEDGELLLTAAADGDARIWSVASGCCLRVLSEGRSATGPLFDAVFCPPTPQRWREHERKVRIAKDAGRAPPAEPNTLAVTAGLNGVMLLWSLPPLGMVVRGASDEAGLARAKTGYRFWPQAGGYYAQ
jgi:WD40 repeat protein